jgi:regulator of protease activity HflC (stomatin/prohibitin superfamily)
MDQSDTPSVPRGIVAPRSHRLVRRLTWLYASMVLGAVVLLSIALLPASMLPGAQALATEAIDGGLGAMVLCALLLALTGLAATLALTTARYRYADAPQRASWRHFDPGFAARVGQAIIVPLGATLVCVCAALLWPKAQGAPASASANIVAAFVFALAFIALISERTMSAFPAPQLPEAPSLRRLLLLTTLLLLGAACVELGRGSGLAWVRWPALVFIGVPILVAVELATRALARLFLPAPETAKATAVAQSIFASLFTGGPRAPGVLLRTHLGLDFARSWALSYLSAAILPAILATALLCWGLSGLKLIDLGQRGIYERFGAPVAVLGPGLHLLLPWPLGVLRPVEYGAIHAVAIGVDQTQEDGASVGAEAPPPLSLNRLWESSHPGQADYLVPSPSTGQQGFQSVSTEISVLYRVGLTDSAALQSVYDVADPESLVKEAASRLVLRYFNSRTLDAVLGASRENIADSLRTELIADLNAHQAGIDIVSVLIEEIHPPAGAAAAYHAVQAAEINANASISDERGRAERTAGIAQQEAHQLTTAATAQAAETLQAANTEAYRFSADRRAFAEGGRAFLLERSYTDLKSALLQTPLTIVDHRLSAAQAPFIDMRTSSSTGGAVTTAPVSNASGAAPAAANAGGVSENGNPMGGANAENTIRNGASGQAGAAAATSTSLTPELETDD